MSTPFRQIKGQAGEDLAAAWLEKQGYMILERNYRFMQAEVDLVAFLPARDYERGGDLVFVEVKWRRKGTFAPPEAAVGRDKQRNLLMAAEAFLHERKLEGTPCRFDIVAITGEGSSLEIEHIPSAFVG
ncbi:MAG: YraN family protein [Bacteroidetes bacterium]|nr:YraN family protein [Bacteroidota bacterium]